MTTAQLARLIATCGGAGDLRPGPGTWGSLVGLLLAVLLMWGAGAAATLIAAVISFAAGLWASGVYARDAGLSDPSEVVIDEAAAIMATVALVPFTPICVVLAFVLFRFFDIVKPWPVSLAERRLKGALGIMADDAVAAALSIGVIWLVHHFLLA